MELILKLKNTKLDKGWDISNITNTVEISDSIDGEAGKLTCIIEKDQYDDLQISNGSEVVFLVDGEIYFKGYVFTIGTDIEGNYKITAYDQMRYLKNQDAKVYKNMTASNIFVDICERFELKYEVKSPTNYVPTAHKFTDNLYSIIKRGLQLAFINDKKYYFIKDVAGTLIWDDLENNKSNIILGDNTSVYGYKYEKSIDKSTYNQIKFYKEENDSIKEPKISLDETTQKYWGILQMTKKVDANMSVAQMKDLADKYLKAYNYETETLSIQADGIPELRAGVGFRFILSRENIDTWMWIKSSTHTFNKYEHLMELEVEAFNGEWREANI